MANKSDNDFKPKLGRLRDLGRSSGKRYVTRVLNAVGKKNARFHGPKHTHGFTGRNIGRGNHAAALGKRGGQARFRQRRVVIKARFIKMVGSGFAKAGAHLRYVQRDGVSKDGEPGQLYGAAHDEVDGEKFLKQSKTDRHQFRFIVSPEDAAELDDMKIFTRDLMAQMEKDLGTKLDWSAVDHYNTDNPHTHIVVRGIADDGKDLVIARDYMSSGMRERASALMTDELGPRQDHEITSALRREVSQDRFTSIDRKLLHMAKGGMVDMRGQPPEGYARFNHSLRLGRLVKLQDMQLTTQTQTGIWHLSENMEATLRDLGLRSDIIKTMHAEMARSGRPTLSKDYEIFRPEDEQNKKIIGKLIGKGLSDEFGDRYYLVVEGVDGKTHYADIGQTTDIEAYKTGSIIELAPQNLGPRKTDHTIADIAKNNKGLYNSDLHARHDPGASKEFIRTHIRRLESLRRHNIVRRFSDGSWEVPRDYLQEVSDIGKAQAKRSPVTVITRAQFSLEVQAQATGATWLDRTLLDPTKTPMSNRGFGAEATDALKRRQAWLVAQGFAKETDKGNRYQRGLLKTLENREVMKVASSITEETGKTFRQAKKGDNIEGVYSKPVELASGRYALIEKSKEFTLVPWRSVLERVRGQSVSGIMSSGGGISWNIGRKKGIGIS